MMNNASKPTSYSISISSNIQSPQGKPKRKKKKNSKVKIRTTFDEMLSDEFLKQQFIEYLKRTHSSEALSFIVDVLAFKEEGDDLLSYAIFTRYLDPDAEEPISIGDQKVLVRLLEKYEELRFLGEDVPVDFFDVIFVQVKDSLETKFAEFKLTLQS
eukprot:TRINITY_DN12234_c0_g1_i1.p1 TRINITY_DN12234_c0_g1~~TRINITY_DN12234_c0_g1_i1.p1  ORF type:complete len:167 (-),score=29.65 TRINITY_DN12234_c0_g1_i1:52-522(-)